MSEKAKLIQEMIAMQQKFMAFEKKNGVTAEDYYATKEGHELHQYREKYAELSAKLNAMAHKEKGSHRFY